MITTKIEETAFIHDSGWYRGNLTRITVPGQPEFEIETWQLMEFAAEMVRTERIQRLENMDTLEILMGDDRDIEARLDNLESVVQP